MSVPMKILGRVRLSKSTEESTSVDRQKELIENWANTNGHKIVAWAEDVDVSGSVSPFDAPELGKYLTPEGAKSWDIIVAWKLDRLARNSIALHKLFGFCQENEKSLVSISENIDLSTWVGRMVAGVIAGVAEGELEAIKERVISSQRKLRELGRWPGGTPPYGWHAIKALDGGYKLEHDPVAFPILRRLIEETIDGKPTKVLASELTNEGVTAPRNHMNGKQGGEWSSQAIRRILSSRTLLGWTMHDNRPVIGDDGLPVLKCPPAVTPEEFDLLQQSLDGRRWAKVSPDRTSPLLGVIKCWHCGANMYHRRAREKASGGYYCPEGCKQYSVNDNHALSIVEEQFKIELGDYKVVRKQISSPTDVSRELAQTEQNYQQLADFISTTNDPVALKTLLGQLGKLENRLTQLREQAAEPETEKWITSDETYSQQWERMDTEQRRQLMISCGLTFRIRQLARGSRHGYAPVEYEFQVPTELEQVLQHQTQFFN